MYDTLIIGAGMSGLAAGIRLAYFDQRVCILERHTTIGGLNSFYRLDGRNYDVGLHAVTNYAPKGTRRGPLARLLKQLRLQWDELSLSPQVGSLIAFPGVSLRFTNDIELLAAEIARHFPGEKDNFQRLREQIADYDELIEADVFHQSARARLSQTIGDPLLVEMLLCPLMFYGNAREHDMDWGQFCILFRSVYLEGLARPQAGIRLILKKLVRKFRELGGELRLRSGVERIHVENGRAVGVVLDDGTQLEARNILSSAGLIETLRLCDDVSRVEAPIGQLSFIESISVLDRQPRQLGYDQTMVFYNDSPQLDWQKPEDLADLRSGVVCSPNNFLYDSAVDALPEGMLRITALANYDAWSRLPEQQYRLEKLRWYDRLAAAAARYIPEFRHAVIATDMFTPTTIRRFTGHANGAVYGAPEKRLSGTTHLSNVFLCGTDQGFVGIIGAIISGIAVANRHLLRVDGPSTVEASAGS